MKRARGSEPIFMRLRSRFCGHTGAKPHSGPLSWARRQSTLSLPQNLALLRSSLMREALRKLDGMDREILLLREFEQLSYAEIAELLNLPVNTVRSRLFRARMAPAGTAFGERSVQQPRNAQTRGGHMIHATTHPFTAEELMAFCDGELSNEESQAAEAHLAECRECAETGAAIPRDLADARGVECAAGFEAYRTSR